MESARNVTASHALSSQHPRDISPGGGDKNAYLYILIVVSFYGVFLVGIMLGYLRTKRREKRRSTVFTRLLYEEEQQQREWCASQRRNSFSLPAFPALLDGGRVLAPLACALCSVEQSSVSSLSSIADVRFAIEEEVLDRSDSLKSVSDQTSDESVREGLTEEH